VRFAVLPAKARVPDGANAAFLERNDWDDFGFKTLFDLYYRDADGTVHFVGAVKIGSFELGRSGGQPDVPDEFDRLHQMFFSLGQDDSYYSQLNSLGDDVRDEILQGLNDVAVNPQLFAGALTQPVTGKSLLRTVSPATVRNQYHRLAQGGLRLWPYEFTYAYPSPPGKLGAGEPPVVSFSVVPESQPPTNVHVIIGSNGVGKSRLLNRIENVLVSHPRRRDAGTIEFTAGDADRAGHAAVGAGEPPARFANLVSVAFSAFDDFEPVSSHRDPNRGLSHTYIGLKKIERSGGKDAGGMKDPRQLAVEFGNSVRICLQGARLARWRRALRVLESDPIFAEAEVASLAEAGTDDEVLRDRARDLFRDLSSGHKIVLLTVTRLVESVEERTLVLLDEPESHLHPPLLSAFVRALSDLLVNRNGVAIIATHSPVVLQEVPRRCVWRLRRAGDSVTAERPDIETFGENVGTLTSEVFGLEVTNSGFHRMIAEAAAGQGQVTYREVLETFDGQLGSEARALLQALVTMQGRGY
jgi:predicted ATPase